MSWIVEHIASWGEKNAIIYDYKEYTYSQLYEQIMAYAKQIEGKIAPGAVVALVSDYNFYSIALFFALYKNKNIIVPITTKIATEIDDRIRVAICDWRINLHEGDITMEACTKESDAHVLLVQLQQQGKAGLILFSSGTTGAPKAMIHNLDNMVDTYQGKRGKNMTFLIFLMFDHIGGLNTLLNCIAMGVTMVFPTKRDADHVCSLIEKYQVNVLPTSPTFLNLILIGESYTKYDLSSLRMITYGTEPMPESLLVKLKNVFTRVKFLQTFGTSETGISQTASKSSDSTYLKIDDPKTEIKIVDGELWIRSKTQIMGYLNASMERFTEDGWFKTGDLVEETEDGYIKIIGRNKELINVGGEKVLPSEVESVLFQMPDLIDCMVYGEQNPITGMMVVAKVLFRTPMKPSEAKKAVTLFCQDKLDRYKIPAKVIQMTESEYTDRFKKQRN